MTNGEATSIQCMRPHSNLPLLLHWYNVSHNTSHAPRYRKITDGCVCDTETQNAYLREARYFVANSTTKLETRTCVSLLYWYNNCIVGINVMIQKQHIVARAALFRVLVHGLFFDAFLSIPLGGQSYVKLSTRWGGHVTAHCPPNFTGNSS
jgi:hypothetical protein